MSYLICGIDEVGRGSIAGPLVAVAAMFHSTANADWRRTFSPIPDVNDSKSFSTHTKRKEVFKKIIRSDKLADFGIGMVSVAEIEAMGIEEANRVAFYRAWKDLKQEPNWILVDGDNPCPAWNYSLQSNRPKGDSYWWPVGAASILAKIIRDEYMVEMGLDYPLYKWAQNAGYATKEHIMVLRKIGPSPHHRPKFIREIISNDSKSLSIND